MASKDSPSKADLISKDAMYLFELMRDSPHPIVLHISAFAEKTGTKVNTIVKRLGEIKKRQGLNIVTTTSQPDGVRSSPVVRQPAAEPKPKVKREKAASKAAKTAAPDNASSGTKGVKAEKREDTEDPTAMHNLPSPADSTSDPPQLSSTKGLKRAFDEAGIRLYQTGNYDDDASPSKKAKTQDWVLLSP